MLKQFCTGLYRDKHIRVAEQVSYRLLESHDEYSFGDDDTPNMLIQGDNLEALKALLPYYVGQVKCILIENKHAEFDTIL